MISFQFETYIADGAEHYSYGADYGKGMVQTSKTVSFPESLLSLVDMNIDEIEPAIRQLNEYSGSLRQHGRNSMSRK